MGRGGSQPPGFFKGDFYAALYQVKLCRTFAQTLAKREKNADFVKIRQPHEVNQSFMPLAR
jgi:hypothetical protein